jgi:hypothetical protein
MGEFIVAVYFHAGRPTEGRTAMCARVGGFVADEMFSITSNVLMADHERTKMSSEFRISLFKVEGSD